MPDIADIVIIGAGLIGLSSADALAARGLRVVVIETRSGPCEGASFSNAGMVHPSQVKTSEGETMAVALAEVDLAKNSARLLRQNFVRLGLDTSLAHPMGCLKLFPSPKAARAAQAAYHALGIVAEPVKTPDYVTADGLGAACYFPDDFLANAYSYGTALAQDLIGRGIDIIYESKNLAVDSGSIGFELQLNVDGRSRKIAAKQLVVAAGMGSPDVLAQLDVPLSLSAVTGHALDFAKPDMTTSDIKGLSLPTVPVMDAQSHSAMSVFPDVVRIAGGWNIKTPQELLTRWSELTPHIMQALLSRPPLRQWTEARPVSMHGHPFISATSVPGLWVNTGHGHMGWTLSAGSGALLADMICDGARADAFRLPILSLA